VENEGLSADALGPRSPHEDYSRSWRECGTNERQPPTWRWTTDRKIIGDIYISHVTVGF